MADQRYDAVVLGGGHHGTIIACYLARAGMSVGVFERAPRLGGGAATVNGPAPGLPHEPVFALDSLLRPSRRTETSTSTTRVCATCSPKATRRWCSTTASSFTGYSAYRVVDPVTGRQERSDENINLTYEQIKRFSTRDAEAYLVLLDQYERYWKPVVRPPSVHDAAAVGTSPTRSKSCVTDRRTQAWSQCISSCRCRRWRTTSSSRPSCARSSCAPRRRRPDASATTRPGCRASRTTCRSCSASSPPRSRSAARRRSPTRSCPRARSAASSTTRVPRSTACSCTGSRATGIRLADGTEVAADLVVSALGIPQTVLRMLADAEVSPRLVERINNIHYDRGQLWWVNVAVHEPPSVRGCDDEPRHRPATTALLGTEGPRLLRDALQGRDLPRGHGATDVRAHVVRHALGPGAGAGGQARHRRRGVRRADPAVRQGSSGATSSSGSPTSSSTSGGATRRT